MSLLIHLKDIINHKVIAIVIVVSAVTGTIAGSVATFVLRNAQKPTSRELIRDFYLTETAVYVSPHTLRKKMDKGENYTLVDVRSPQEYEKEHIIGDIN